MGFLVVILSLNPIADYFFLLRLEKKLQGLEKKRLRLEKILASRRFSFLKNKFNTRNQVLFTFPNE